MGQVVQFAFRNPPPVKDNVAGRFEMKTNEVQKYLGSVAWAVFVCLIWHRDAEGLTRIRRKTITTKTKYTERQVRRALSRLTRVGIIEIVGYDTFRGKDKGSMPIRRVLGDYRNRQVTFPGRVIAQFKKLPNRGGKRTGAGRPKQGSKPGSKQPKNVRENTGSARFEYEIKSGPVKNQKRAGQILNSSRKPRNRVRRRSRSRPLREI